jgi:hypothetical protein
MLYNDFAELQALFASLSPDERKAFAATVKDRIKALSSRLKENDEMQCPHCQNMKQKWSIKLGTYKDVQWYICREMSKDMHLP